MPVGDRGVVGGDGAGDQLVCAINFSNDAASHDGDVGRGGGGGAAGGALFLEILYSRRTVTEDGMGFRT